MQTTTIYTLPILLITSWWSLAFWHSSASTMVERLTPPTQHKYDISSIALIKRDQLKTALAGDVDLMTSLIADWDLEAQLLHQMGTEGVERLAPEHFLRSQILGRNLRPDREITSLERSLISTSARDPTRRNLPQTYAAASILLALTDPTEIVALPEMMRDQTQLFPAKLTEQIPLDISRYNSEKLFLMAPSIAFVAHYSQPTTVQAFEDQGIALYKMGNIDSLVQVSHEIAKMGDIIERPQKAELLTIFLEAAVCAIDNQLKILTKKILEKQKTLPRVLFLNHFEHFSVPSASSLSGQLLERIALFDITLDFAAHSGTANEWVVPIGKEQIVNLNPDCILIVTADRHAIEDVMHRENTLQNVQAVKNHCVYFLDDAIQLSPTQYTVLAYQDLIEALAQLL